MTTGATGQLGLALPVQGELSGTWGDTVNNGLTQYINIAIAGTLTLTGDGAVTLANTTGDASASNVTSSLTGAGTVTAQFAIVRVTGTLTVAKVVTGPSYSKTYTVVNAATGGIVTFKASGQTGVSVAVGETAFVYFNGTDYVKVVGTATAGAAGGSNTQVQFNSSGILAGSANMTFNGTTLTVNDLTDSSLTATRVVFAGTAGNLTDSANLTWDGTTLSSTQVNITGQGTLRLQDTTGGEYVGLRSPSALGASYTLTFPADDGTSGQALITDGSGVLSWSTAASGDVYGPGSSTDNAVARFDSTTGKLLQNSVVLIGDTGAVTGVTDLTASGSVTLSGGTANGVTYLNGSKVLTSGSLLTFDGNRLAITGNSANANRVDILNDNGNATFRVGYDTSNNLTITRNTGDANIYLNATQSGAAQVWQLAGTEVYRITSSSLYTASGINVGIGTSSPSAKLDVTGVVRVNNSGAETKLWLDAAGGYNNFIYYREHTVADRGVIGFAAGSGNLQFRMGAYDMSSGTQSMTLTSGGNLLVGTTSPNARLTVSSGATTFAAEIATTGTNTYTPTASTSLASSTLQLVGGNASGATTGIRISQSSSFELFFGGVQESGGAGAFVFQGYSGSAYAERMRIDSAGNVGIGTSSPTTFSGYTVLEVKGPSEGGRITANYNNSVYMTMFANSNGLGYVGTNSAHPAVFITSGTERARITADGYFLAGTTTNISGNGRITSKAVSSGSALVLGYSSGSLMADFNDNGNLYLPIINSNTTASSANVYIDPTYAVMQRSTSALKYKQDIRDLESIDISKFRAVRYKSKCKYDDQTKDHFGFIADEVDASGVKELVSYGVNGEVEGFQYDRMTAVLLKAIQEQQAIIESLKARLDAANL